MKPRLLTIACALSGLYALGADASDASPDTLTLKTVDVFDTQKFGVRSAQMSAVQVSGEQIKITPAVFGEHDVLKTLQMQPGVTQADDGRAALYVRGGDYDQNLIMIDGVPFYNSEHMAGFMSAMNPDMVGHADFYTGAFPSRFGGRLSSIVDISLLDGDDRHYKATAAVGMLSSRLNVQGPIVKGRSSFNFGARVSYFDAIVKPIYKMLDKNGDGLRPYNKINFYDFTLKTRFDLWQGAKLSVMAYYSHDVYNSAPSDSKGDSWDEGVAVPVKATLVPMPGADGSTGAFRGPVTYNVARSTEVHTDRTMRSGTDSRWNTFLASARLDWGLGRGYSMSLTAATSMLWYTLEMRQSEESEITTYRMLRRWGPQNPYDENAAEDTYVPRNYLDENFLERLESNTFDRQRFHSDVIDASISAAFGKRVGSHSLRWGLLAKSMGFNPRVDVTRSLHNVGTKAVSADETWQTDSLGHVPTHRDFDRYAKLVSVPDYSDTRKDLDVDSAVGRRQNLQTIDLYAEDDWQVTKDLRINYGLRLSSNIAKGKAYANIEPRISAAYMLADGKGAVKASLSMMSQGVHYLYSSNLVVMSGIWVPSTKKFAPTTSMIAAAGLCWELPWGLYASAEGYYKTMNNLIEYSEGASYFQIPDDWQAISVAGRGRAFGADLLISKTMGKVTGQVKYSWSKSRRLFDREGQMLNGGRWFYAPNDRRNVASAMLVYRPDSHWTISASWSYMSGRRATMASHTFFGAMLDAFDQYHDWTTMFLGASDYAYQVGYQRYIETYILSFLQYSTSPGRNQLKLPANHHLDLSVDYAFRTGKIGHCINLSVYNIYNRKNWSRVYITSDEDAKLKLTGLCCFPLMPSLTYTITF